MSVKKAVLGQVMKLAQNPMVMEVVTSPQVMELAMKAMSLRAQASTAASGATHAVARTLNLATREEVRELRRTIRKLEEQLAASRAHDDDQKA